MSEIRHHEAPLSDVAKAYGCLWTTTGWPTPQVSEARKLLLGRLTNDEQRAGIEWAIKEFGAMTDAEARGIDVAQVLPGERS